MAVVLFNWGEVEHVDTSISYFNAGRYHSSTRIYLTDSQSWWKPVVFGFRHDTPQKRWSECSEDEVTNEQRVTALLFT